MVEVCARAEGIVEKLEYTEEEALERARHQAEEHGTEFDPSTVTGPETVYQIKGIGAVMEASLSQAPSHAPTPSSGHRPR